LYELFLLSTDNIQMTMKKCVHISLLMNKQMNEPVKAPVTFALIRNVQTHEVILQSPSLFNTLVR
jgi:hypothetical protein